ncbi:MAG: MBOAT family protein [Candidatus Schekmanbacteria bacterium]|nr:MBOAT family protein [Candidatus Schekmanbacteria bacterium]
MLFSSLVFIFNFLPIVIILYYLLNSKYRNAFLLLSSLLFYAWGEGRYVFVMILSSAIDYICGLIIYNSRKRVSVYNSDTELRRAKTIQRLFLSASIFGNLGLLFFFKYFEFGIANINAAAQLVGANSPFISTSFSVILPLGISFYTFQSMSYTIDVYRGEVEATSNIVDFACFVTLFPQLVAGPIVRYKDLACELKDRECSISAFSDGVARFTTGLGKKVLISNVVAKPADVIFGLPAADLTFELAWLGALCYTLQIYFDFSGYSDMAIGLGRMFGFHFPENFNYPYAAKSIKDFWRRWHISLSTWFRDYLYVSLGGNRQSVRRTYFNLITVFFICGLWHGASWNFVVWGLFHGVFLAGERTSAGRALEKLPSPIRSVYVMLVVITGWVFFRADTLGSALSFLAAMVGAGAEVSAGWPTRQLINPELVTIMICGAILSAPVINHVGTVHKYLTSIAGKAQPMGDVVRFSGAVLRTAWVASIFVLAVASLTGDVYNPFIYFRF